jgi:hypothetical protein
MSVPVSIAQRHAAAADILTVDYYLDGETLNAPARLGLKICPVSTLSCA